MSRRNIGTMWDRDNRNNMNDNFMELYAKYQDYFKEVTEDLREELLSGSHIDIKGYVQAVTNLPRSAEDGDTYFVVANGEWHRWNGNSWDAVAKTDPSEFVALRNELVDMGEETDGIIAGIKRDFDNFKLNILESVDSKIGEIDTTVSEFVESLGDQVVFIVEEGSGVNGNYVRYSDGWQVCWHSVEGLVPDDPYGALFISPSERWDFPKAFRAEGDFWVSLNVYSIARWALPSGLTDASSYAFRQIAAKKQSSSKYPTFLKAEGWWK